MMRRKEKEITDLKEIELIIQRAQVCRLAMVDKDGPYIVPLCFGYQNKTFYFHSAPEGRKVNIIKRNPRVCVELDADLELVGGNVPCNFGMHFTSVIAFGKATIIQELDLKREALQIIHAQYSDQAGEMTDKAITNTLVFEVVIDRMTGKQS
jgi:uncharacterized protein